MATYLMSIPLLVAGAVVMVVLMRLSGLKPQQGEGPEHPIQRMLQGADAGLIIQILIAACLVAPLVEETFFRGVLYRHLREATRGWALLLSVLVSLLANTFISRWSTPRGPSPCPH